jgi:hypothetical protein
MKKRDRRNLSPAVPLNPFWLGRLQRLTFPGYGVGVGVPTKRI